VRNERTEWWIFDVGLLRLGRRKPEMVRRLIEEERMNGKVDRDEKLFQERGFHRRVGLGGSPALIIIDMQKGFTNPNATLGSNLDAQVEAITPLLEVAHERKIPVFFTACVYDDPDLKDAGIWINKIGGLQTLRAGTENVEIDQRLDVRSGDAMLRKKYASSFFGTDLNSQLTAQRIDTLIITGCTTSGCVRATAVDSCQSGFRPIVVQEAVGDRSAAAHEQSLFDLDAKYADVMSLQDVLSYMRTVGHNVKS
jgi:nicotinamidase-related amidase